MNTVILRTLCSTHAYKGVGLVTILSPAYLRPRVPYRLHTTTTTASTINKASLTKASKDAPPQSQSVNGPRSTLPPDIDLPALPAETSKYQPKFLFNTAKAYAVFYKSAVINIWRNRNAVIDLRLSLAPQYKGSVLAAAKDHAVSRSDFQLWERSRRDFKKVPLFALLFLVCGEFTPLLVIALGGIVPPSAWIPKQLEGWRREIEQRRKQSFRNLTLKVDDKVKDAYAVDNLQREHLLHVGRSLGLYSTVWERVGGPPMWLLQRRLRQWEEYLRIDGQLIQKGGGVQYMNSEEILRACVERGLDVVNLTTSQRQTLLDFYMAQGKVPIMKLLLTRPSVWGDKQRYSTHKGSKKG